MEGLILSGLEEVVWVHSAPDADVRIFFQRSSSCVRVFRLLSKSRFVSQGVVSNAFSRFIERAGMQGCLSGGDLHRKTIESVSDG